MTEIDLCKDCQHNDYPYCNATLLPNGERMLIDNLDENNFNCGLKYHDQIDMSVLKTREELLQEKIDELEARIIDLETLNS